MIKADGEVKLYVIEASTNKNILDFKAAAHKSDVSRMHPPGAWKGFGMLEHLRTG